jgi:hypothetical protein
MMNHSAMGDPQDGPKKTISQNELAYGPTLIQMPPPNQKIISFENYPINRVKGKLVVPTAVAYLVILYERSSGELNSSFCSVVSLSLPNGIQLRYLDPNKMR